MIFVLRKIIRSDKSEVTDFDFLPKKHRQITIFSVIFSTFYDSTIYLRSRQNFNRYQTRKRVNIWQTARMKLLGL